VKVLFIGDIVGRPGRTAAKECSPLYRKSTDLIIANGENAAGGTGITFDIADDLWALGIDVITLGNHVWDKKEIFDFIDDADRVVRPLNYPEGTPGKGFTTVEVAGVGPVSVINACGRVFSTALLEDPFRSLDSAVSSLRALSPIIIVDFHAEATSEKVALGHYLDGKVSAVLGTHTHVQTSDATLLSRGTGYITDVGMTGPRDSVIGMSKEIVMRKFLTQLPARFEVAGGPWRFDAVMLEIDPVSGRCLSINSICHLENA